MRALAIILANTSFPTSTHTKGLVMPSTLYPLYLNLFLKDPAFYSTFSLSSFPSWDLIILRVASPQLD